MELNAQEWNGRDGQGMEVKWTGERKVKWKDDRKEEGKEGGRGSTESEI